MRAALLITLLALGGCDTFRSLDSVPVPGGDPGDMGDVADGGSLDMPADLDAESPLDMPTRDLGDGPRDMPRPDMDMNMPDFAPDLPDSGGPVTCPDVDPPAPEFTTAISFVVVGEVLGDVGELAEEEVSIAASAAGPGQATFVTAHRAERSGVMEAILTAYPTDGAASELLLTHAVAQPFTDVAVARAPDVDEFSFLAAAATPGCVGTGIQAISGRVSVSSGIDQLNVASIDDACGTVVPRVALTGAESSEPNVRIVSTSLISGDVRAYPWDDASLIQTTTGSQFVDHVSASTLEAVITPTANLDEWWFSRPALAEQPMRVDIGGAGDLEVEHLYDECYAVATPNATDVFVAPVNCEVDCTVETPTTIAIGETVSRADVAPMPGGGFVVVTAVGQATQRLEARFFDDAYQPRDLDGQSVVVLVPPGPRIADFSIASTTDEQDMFVGAVYSTADASVATVSLAVLRISFGP